MKGNVHIAGTSLVGEVVMDDGDEDVVVRWHREDQRETTEPVRRYRLLPVMVVPLGEFTPAFTLMSARDELDAMIKERQR